MNNAKDSQSSAKVDRLCKEILADKLILAIIMKNSIESYKYLTLHDIANNYIEPNSLKISDKEVESNISHPKIKGSNTEDSSVEDGTIYYDILFEAKLPESQENCLIDINIEVQSKYNPGYSLLKRAIYYCSRMLSSQANRMGMNQRYKGLHKVYSVWLCLNPPENLKNTMNSYSLTERHIIGETVENKGNYDMLEVLMLYLNLDGNLERKDFLSTISLILNKNVPVKNKDKFLIDNYNVSLSEIARERMDSMCNYSEYIKEESRKEKAEEIATNLLKKGLAINLINETTGLPIEKIKELEEDLKSNSQETSLFK